MTTKEKMIEEIGQASDLDITWLGYDALSAFR